MRLFVVVLNLLQNVLEMLKLITFTTIGCETSRMVEERIEQAIIDMSLQEIINNDIAILEGNSRLAKYHEVTDAPTIVCINTKAKLFGLHSPCIIRQWIREQLKEIAYGED